MGGFEALGQEWVCVCSGSTTASVLGLGNRIGVWLYVPVGFCVGRSVLRGRTRVRWGEGEFSRDFEIVVVVVDMIVTADICGRYWVYRRS